MVFYHTMCVFARNIFIFVLNRHNRQHFSNRDEVTPNPGNHGISGVSSGSPVDDKMMLTDIVFVEVFAPLSIGCTTFYIIGQRAAVDAVNQVVFSQDKVSLVVPQRSCMVIMLEYAVSYNGGIILVFYIEMF